MPTIKDLIDKHSKVPGDIRVNEPGWGEQWFRPYYVIDDSGDWRGISSLSGDDIFSNYGDYQLYEEPKPKVKRAQYLVIRPEGYAPFTTVQWCLDEDEARDHLVNVDPSECKFIRLEEREFDR